MRVSRHRIKVSAPLALTALVLLSGTAPAEAEPEEVWRAEGFDEPESVVFDSERDVLYVSNVSGNEKNGQGYISQLSVDGEVVEARWVEGLNAPKGMDVRGGRLYVSDIDRLVEIDIDAGEVATSYEGPEAEFLNDVTIDSEGRVFVSDMDGNAIYALEGEDFAIWMEDEALMSPNGLFAEEDRLVVASWGEGGDSSGTPGHLKTVAYDSKAIEDLGDGTPVGNLDGLEPDGEGRYLVTDWMAGALHRVQPSGEAEQLLDLEQGSADLEVRDGLALIPMMMDGEVRAYRIE